MLSGRIGYALGGGDSTKKVCHASMQLDPRRPYSELQRKLHFFWYGSTFPFCLFCVGCGLDRTTSEAGTDTYLASSSNCCSKRVVDRAQKILVTFLTTY
ncbi:unnamed protein product [Amoebophrya sp. A120]|nr:unnamed protein product [Amoebophrya sp. A120]|eukprot:GSA120T00023320001.1